MGLSVRVALAGDANTLAALNRFVHDLHVAQRPEYFRATSLEDIGIWFKAQLAKPTTGGWVAEGDGVAIGYALVFFHDRAASAFRQPWRSCEIDQIAVDPAWRRRGVARALMRAAFEEARARSVRRIELSSWAFNTGAQAAFRRLGFEPRVVGFELTLPK